MSAASQRRVVITGLGAICPLGDTPEGIFSALQAGQSGVGPLQALPAGGLPVNIAAEARCFTGDAENYGPVDKELKKTVRKSQKVMCREIQMGVAAAMRALFHSGLIPDRKYVSERTGCVFGSDYMLTDPDEFTPGVAVCAGGTHDFDFHKWATDAFPKLYPLWLLKYLPNMPAAHVSILNDLQGPNNSVTLREASSNSAIGEAFRTIARGHADVMVTGATGTRVQIMKSIHAVQTEELAKADDPTKATRPFDKQRTGMVMGEGAGSIIIEELSHAQARGATIYGEVLGHASATVANRQRVADRARALELVLQGCLRDANKTARDIGHIHAHGLGTQSCDVAEATAISRVFGSQEQQPWVVTAKSAFGNLGAASGVVELIASVMALRSGTLFPVQNYETPDPACPIRVNTSNSTAAGNCFINLSVTPQGQASGMLIGAWRE
jgi:3-oxoacyl-[acyl-carrier-protein] synthase II